MVSIGGLMTDKPMKNGANIVIMAPGNERILMVRLAYGEKYWALPGGEMEPNETPEETAERECFEETSITPLRDFKLVGIMPQRQPFGVVILMSTAKFKGEISVMRQEEILEARFMSLREIASRQHHIGLGYARMIGIWYNNLYSSTVYQKPLSNKVTVHFEGKNISF